MNITIDTIVTIETSDNNDSENICIICHNTDELIEYSHKCGNYIIHQKCLDLWNSENNSCFICREPVKNNNIIAQTIVQTTVCTPIYISRMACFYIITSIILIIIIVITILIPLYILKFL